jgi:hypothetical protein
MPVIALLAAVPLAALLWGDEDEGVEAEVQRAVTLKLSEASDIIPMTPRADKL